MSSQTFVHDKKKTKMKVFYYFIFSVDQVTEHCGFLKRTIKMFTFKDANGCSGPSKLQ